MVNPDNGILISEGNLNARYWVKEPTRKGRICLICLYDVMGTANYGGGGFQGVGEGEGWVGGANYSLWYSNGEYWLYTSPEP